VSLVTVHFNSQGIGRATAMNVLVPDEGQGPFPVLLLLHGLGAAYDSYCRSNHIENLLRGRPVLAVMPDGGRSFYANDARPGGLRYEDHILQDALGYVERVFPARRDRQGRAVIGISMGGYGALLLALRHPEMFCATASISGSTYFAHEPSERHRDDDVGYLAAALPRQKNDLFCLAEALARGDLPLAIRQSCGSEDFLYATNLAFHRHLEALGVAHDWVQHPGEHDQRTWDEQLPLALQFTLQQLGVA